MFDNLKIYDNLGEIITDFLFLDLRNPIIQKQLLTKCYSFLRNKVSSYDDFMLLNIDIKFDKFGDFLTVKGNNLITSLWLIGVYPENPNHLKDCFNYKQNNIEYIYDSKTKKIIIKEKKYVKK